MGTKKEVEFEVGDRTYRLKIRLDNSYDIHGFNSLRQTVTVNKDLNSGQQVFVNWDQIPVLRFIDDSDRD